LSGCLEADLLGGEPAQLVVDQRQKLAALGSPCARACRICVTSFMGGPEARSSWSDLWNL
jgi:hypothetical protein